MRDVIQVETQDGPAAGPDSLAQLARVADELLPPLVARLGVSDLGEIEVRQGSWRVRIRRASASRGETTAAQHPAAGPSGSATSHTAPAASNVHAAPAGSPGDQPMARS